MKQTMLYAAIFALVAGSTGAYAAVSADEAAKLKSSLTPLGGEKAGNKVNHFDRKEYRHTPSRKYIY